MAINEIGPIFSRQRKTTCQFYRREDIESNEKKVSKCGKHGVSVTPAYGALNNKVEQWLV
jgi:hypothetical protein